MTRITAKQLVKHNACPDRVALFRRTFPHGAPITTAAAAKARKAGLDVSWLAGLLPAPLLDEYERQKAPLWAEYERQKAPLLAEYKRQEGPLWAEYKRQEAPLWAEYERQKAPLLAEYERQVDSLLLKLLRKVTV